MALTQDIILTFLLEHGGKVKNSELLNNFKCQINCSDPAEKKHNRDLFKKIVNSVAVVKQSDEVKFVVLKKRYQDFVKAGSDFNAQKSDIDDSFSSLNTSFSTTCSERSASLKKIQNKNPKYEDSKYTESVPLEPITHEWLVKSAAGMWGQVYGLLLQDTQLAIKKDFMSGFTAIHWAVKDGNEEMVRKIMHISKRRGKCVDINTRTHGGYTPLHIAAIHGHFKVMTLLVQGYGANTNIRDNDGKKPYHYLSKNISHDIRELLGGPQVSNYMYMERTDDDDYREIPKGFNTLSRLFHSGHRKKNRHQQQIAIATNEGD
ncbi:uncharacterized protein sowahab [Aplochiton taeniatus]